MTLTPHPPPEPAVTGSLRVEAWRDPVVEAHGHDPRSRYAERYWLPTVGPGSWCLARLLVDGLEASPDGFDADLAALGRSLGLRGTGRHSPLGRTLARLAAFGLASSHGAHGLYRARLAWPPLTQRRLSRLPDHLVALHPSA